MAAYPNVHELLHRELAHQDLGNLALLAIPGTGHARVRSVGNANRRGAPDVQDDNIAFELSSHLLDGADRRSEILVTQPAIVQGAFKRGAAPRNKVKLPLRETVVLDAQLVNGFAQTLLETVVHLRHL